MAIHNTGFLSRAGTRSDVFSFFLFAQFSKLMYTLSCTLDFLIGFVTKKEHSHWFFILTFDPTLKLRMDNVYFGTRITPYN
jgi:hypothetical protein